MIYVLVGAYGSGKSEVAANLAISENLKVIVDLDVVNPYFRTSDIKEEVSALGIEVICPRFAGSNVDIPALTADINKVFAQGLGAVFDVGGEDDGATVLGRFREELQRQRAEVIMVVNMKRPQTSSVSGVLELKSNIETASGLKVSRIINNTNLLGETKVEDLLKAQAELEKTNVPVWKISGMAGVLDGIPEQYEGMKLVLERKIIYGEGVD